MACNMKVAHIDLNLSRTELKSIDPILVRKWGRGSGVASWRLYNEVGPDAGPFDPGNVVSMIGGPLTGTGNPAGAGGSRGEKGDRSGRSRTSWATFAV
jgi:aldehyde:ferredoxin oxidoreductase